MFKHQNPDPKFFENTRSTQNERGLHSQADTLLVQTVLWNFNYFLRFRFRLLKSYGSGSGSDFRKSYVPVPVPFFIKVTVPVPVPAPYLDHKKLIFQKKNWKFFCLFTIT